MVLKVNTRQVGLEESIESVVNRINRRGLRVKINASDFTQPLGRITQKADEFTKSLEASNARVIAFGASAAIIGGVAKGFEQLVVQAVKFEKIMTDINVVLGTSASNLAKFGDNLFKVARNTSQALDVAAEAALEFSRQGLSMEETLKRTNDALILTRLTGIKAADAVSGLTAAVNGFADAGLTTTNIINKLAAVDVKFAVSADDLIDALARAGAVAQDAGVNFDQLVGAVTSAQQITARGGAVIGNSFKTIFTRIQRSSTLDRLEELGVAVRDLYGSTLPALTVLQNLSKSYDKLGSSTKAAVAEQVGGVFQINVLKAALKDLNRENSLYAQATQISSSATDQAQQKNAQLQKTISSLAAQTSLTIQELSKNIGELALAPGISNLLEAINSIGTSLNNILGTGEQAGSDFAKGLVRGIGNVITGPGVVLAFGIFAKLFANALKFAKSSLKDVLGIVTQKDKERQIQESIVMAMSQNRTLAQELNKYAGDKTKQEQIMLGVIKEQTRYMLQQQKIASSIAPGLARSGVGADLTFSKNSSTSSSGFIPNFSRVNPSEAAKERGGALKSGYSPGSVKDMTIKGFGRVVYNDAESVKQFPGMGQPAIMPPQDSMAGKRYKSNFIDRHGFDPYASSGFVPNFSNSAKRIPGTNILRLPQSKMGVETTFAKGKGIHSKKMTGLHIMEASVDNVAANIKELAPELQALKSAGINVLQRPIFFTDFDQSKKAGRATQNAATRKRMTSDAKGKYFEQQLSKRYLSGKGYTQTKKNAKVDFISRGQDPIEAKFGSSSVKDENIIAKSIRLYRGNSIRQFLQSEGLIEAGKSIRNKNFQDSLAVLNNAGINTKGLSLKEQVKLVKDYNLFDGFIPNFAPERVLQKQKLIVRDGDSVEGLVAIAPPSIDHRLAGVDAIEKQQSLGNRATQLAINAYKGQAGLSRLQKTRVPGGRAAYGRGLFNDEDLAKDLVRKGLGIPDLRYVGRGKYAAQVREAQSNRMGIWHWTQEGHPKREFYNQQTGVLENLSNIKTGQKGKRRFSDADISSIESSGVLGLTGRGSGVKKSAAMNLFNSSQKNNPYASSRNRSYAGFIPNFVSPLEYAISREEGAGVPRHQIRIERDDSLRSKINPMGLAVTNIRDEPNGVKQGILRARQMGIDPKTYGASSGLIPNYADQSNKPLFTVSKETRESLKKTGQATGELTGRLFALTSLTYLLEGAFSEAEGAAGSTAKTFIGLTQSVAQGALVFQALQPLSEGLGKKLTDFGGSLSNTGGILGKSKGVFGSLIKGLGGAAKFLPGIGTAVSILIPAFQALTENIPALQSETTRMAKAMEKTTKSIDAVSSAIEATTSVQETQQKIIELTNSGQANSYQGQMKLLELNSKLVKDQSMLSDSSHALGRELNLSQTELESMTSGTAAGMDKLREAMARLTAKQAGQQAASVISDLSEQKVVYNNMNRTAARFNTTTAADQAKIDESSVRLAGSILSTGVTGEEGRSDFESVLALTQKGGQDVEKELLKLANNFDESNVVLSGFLRAMIGSGASSKKIEALIRNTLGPFDRMAESAKENKKEIELQQSISRELRKTQERILHQTQLQASIFDAQTKLMKQRQGYAIQAKQNEIKLVSSLNAISDSLLVQKKLALETEKIDQDYNNKNKEIKQKALLEQQKLVKNIFTSKTASENFSTLSPDPKAETSEDKQESLDKKRLELQKQLQAAGQVELANRMGLARNSGDANNIAMKYVLSLKDTEVAADTLRVLEQKKLISSETMNNTLKSIEENKKLQLDTSFLEHKQALANLAELKKQFNIEQNGVAAAQAKVDAFKKIKEELGGSRKLAQEIQKGMDDDLQAVIETKDMQFEINAAKREQLGKQTYLNSLVDSVTVAMEDELTTQLETLAKARARLKAEDAQTPEGEKLRDLTKQTIEGKVSNESAGFSKKIRDRNTESFAKFKPDEFGKNFFENMADFNLVDLQASGEELAEQFRANKEAGVHTQETLNDIAEEGRSFKKSLADIQERIKRGVFGDTSRQSSLTDFASAVARAQASREKSKEFSFEEKKSMKDATFGGQNAFEFLSGKTGFDLDVGSALTDLDTEARNLANQFEANVKSGFYQQEATLNLSIAQTKAKESAERFAENLAAGKFEFEAFEEMEQASRDFTQEMIKARAKLANNEFFREGQRNVQRRQFNLAGGVQSAQGERAAYQSQGNVIRTAEATLKLAEAQKELNIELNRNTLFSDSMKVKLAELNVSLARFNETLAETTFDSVKDGMRDFVKDVAKGTSSLGDAAISMMAKIANAIQDKMLDHAADQITSGLMGMMGFGKNNNGGLIRNYNTGGSVGGGKVPSMLTAGEYVVKKKIVDRLGSGTLNKINESGSLEDLYNQPNSDNFDITTEGAASIPPIMRFQDGGQVASYLKQRTMGLDRVSENERSSVDGQIVNDFTGALDQTLNKHLSRANPDSRGINAGSHSSNSTSNSTNNSTNNNFNSTQSFNNTSSILTNRYKNGGSVTYGNPYSSTQHFTKSGDVNLRDSEKPLHKVGAFSGTYPTAGLFDKGKLNDSTNLKTPYSSIQHFYKGGKAQEELSDGEKVASGTGYAIGSWGASALFGKDEPSDASKPPEAPKYQRLNTRSRLNLDYGGKDSRKMSARFRANNKYAKEMQQYHLDMYEYNIQQHNKKITKRADAVAGIGGALAMMGGVALAAGGRKIYNDMKYKSNMTHVDNAFTNMNIKKGTASTMFGNSISNTNNTISNLSNKNLDVSSLKSDTVYGNNLQSFKMTQFENSPYNSTSNYNNLSNPSYSSISSGARLNSKTQNFSASEMFDNNRNNYFNRTSNVQRNHHGGIISNVGPYSYFNQGGHVSQSNPYSYFNRGGNVSHSNPYSYFYRGGNVSHSNPYSYFHRGGNVSHSNPYSYFHRGGSVINSNPYSYFNRGGNVSNANSYSYFNRGGDVVNANPYSYYNSGGLASVTHSNYSPSFNSNSVNASHISKYSQGGKVYGPGGVDKVGPVLLDKGEYVIKASSVNKVEKKFPGFFDKLNASKMNNGGTVGGETPSTSTPTSTESSNSSETNNSSVVVNINVSSNGSASVDGGGGDQQAFASKIKDAVVGVISQEKRAGGMLRGK